jgi:hypothetical protein
LSRHWISLAAAALDIRSTGLRRWATPVRVARKLGEHWPSVLPGLVAAVLLHDAPFFVNVGELNVIVAARCGPAVLAALSALQAEHALMGLYLRDPGRAVARLAAIAPDLRCALAADKAVIITAVLRRAHAAPTTAVYWAGREPFLRLVPYFQVFLDAARPTLPRTLTAELAGLVCAAERAATGAGAR